MGDIGGNRQYSGWEITLTTRSRPIFEVGSFFFFFGDDGMVRNLISRLAVTERSV